MVAITKRGSCRGFTLVELLVVIGIIVILGGLAMPAYNMAMTHARTAKCSSNLRTIGAAMLTYANDNNGNLPESGGTIYHSGGPNSPTVDSATGQSSWTEQLEPYLGPSSFNGTTPIVNPIFQCPDWPNVVSSATGRPLSTTGNSCKYYSYFNGSHAAGAGGSGAGAFAAVNLLRIQAPSAHIIAGDIAFDGYQMLDADPDDYGANNPAFKGLPGTPIRLHGGSVNLIFADGHGENVKNYDPANMTTHYAGIEPTAQYTDYP